MTYAPQPLLDARAFLKGEDADLDNNEVGIVGGPGHIKIGTSYHLGKDQLIMSKDPYSARTQRDKNGLADPEICNAACALDVDDDLDELRPMSVWIVEECRKPNPHPDTLDIREVIYSPDGVTVWTWDREKGQTSAPQQRGDSSHIMHTHFDWYRDATRRNKDAIFRRYYTSHQRMVIDMWFGILPDGAMYACTGINSRYLGGGAYESTVIPLEAAGVPRLPYKTLAELEVGGGPVVKEGASGAAKISIPAQELDAVISAS